MNNLYNLIEKYNTGGDKTLFKFFDKEKQIIHINNIGKGAYARIECYFNLRINRFYALKIFTDIKDFEKEKEVYLY